MSSYIYIGCGIPGFHHLMELSKYLYLFWCWSLTCTLLGHTMHANIVHVLVYYNSIIAWDKCSRVHVPLKVHRALRSNTIVGVGHGTS
jgi:hypothetical protein